MSHLLLPETASAHAVVRRFDTQILVCVEDEDLSLRQQNKLRAWAHRHLLSTSVAAYLDARTLATTDPALTRLIHPCDSSVEMITQMLRGGIPLGADQIFECPPTGCSRADALARKLPGWLRRRIVHAAQRTRLHTAQELSALWQAVKIHLLGGAIVWLRLTEWLDDDADMPDVKVIHAAALGCLKVMRAERGIAWTPAGVVLQGAP